MRSRLEWKMTGDRPICETRVFTVYEQEEYSDAGPRGTYVSVAAPDWVVIVPVLGDDFVMVRQWRHGEQRITMEFPGGVCDPGEDTAETAMRELMEETGYQPGKITRLGSFSTNPALFRNHVHFYLAEELVSVGEQRLDSDEVLAYTRVPISEAIANVGTGESTHAFTATAMMLYLREKNKIK